MIIGLRQRINEYSQNIKAKSPDYIALYDYFVQYLERQPQYRNKSFEVLFGEELRSSDIVGACVHYVENSNAYSETAISKFLNAMTKLYKDIIAPYHNETLGDAIPFSKLADQVSQYISKDLKDQTSCPPITKNDYDQVLRYFRVEARNAELKQQKEIIVKLLLLYGFKFERIKKMKKDSIDLDKRIIRVDASSGSMINLSLPYNLSCMLGEYIKGIETKQDYLFLNKKGNQIEASFLDYAFRRIRSIAGKTYDKAFSATGLAKYAIIEMMEKKINLLSIKDITGMEDDVINDCARIYLQSISSIDGISEINGKLNTIQAYKDFSQEQLQ